MASRLVNMTGGTKQMETSDIYRSLFEDCTSVMLLIDPETAGIEDANIAATKFYGYSKDELTSMKITDINTLTEQEVRNEMRLAAKEDRNYFNFRHKIASGETRDVEVYSGPIEIKGRKLLYSIIHDVSERKKTEEALAKSMAEWNYAMDFFEDAIYLIDMDDKVVRDNKAFYNLTGLSPEKTIGMDISLIIHPQGEPVPCPVCIARKERHDELITMEADHPDNPAGRPIEVMVKMIRNDSGEPVGVLMGIHDLTRQKETEREISKSLREKEILLREVHHRVKNNMAVINALLKLQAPYVKDAVAAGQFIELQNRIRAMALVHEKLYSSKDFAKINVIEYMKSLARHIIGTTGEAIRLEIDILPFDLEPDALIPCGLIVNEVLSNAYKHAFNGSGAKLISLSANRNDDGMITLVIKDNGMGLPDGFDLDDSPGLGLKLVSSLISQLNGTVEMKSEGGTEFTFSFPEKMEFAGRA
jgi:PAS domain S-box-containing protein